MVPPEVVSLGSSYGLNQLMHALLPAGLARVRRHRQEQAVPTGWTTSGEHGQYLLRAGKAIRRNNSELEVFGRPILLQPASGFAKRAFVVNHRACRTFQKRTINKCCREILSCKRRKLNFTAAKHPFSCCITYFYVHNRYNENFAPGMRRSIPSLPFACVFV